MEKGERKKEKGKKEEEALTVGMASDQQINNWKKKEKGNEITKISIRSIRTDRSRPVLHEN